MGSINLYRGHSESVCPNCGEAFRTGYDHCPHCSQKSGLGIHSVFHMIGEFFANTFNFESRLSQTALGLLKPGFLTREYLATRRVHYLSPIRVFIVLMFILFFVLSISGIDFLHFNTQFDNEGVIEVKEQTLNRANVLQNLSADNYINQQLTELKSLIGQRDLAPEVLEQATQTIQNLKALLALDLNKTFKVSFFGENYEILRRDIYQLSADNLIEKYQVKGQLDQLAFRAFLRFTQDPDGFLKFLFSNMTWAIFLDVLLMAGLFKLFYPKTRYVVHFVYHLHLRSFIFLGLMLVIGLYALIPSGWIIGLSILGLSIYIALSLQRVYPRNKLKTTAYFIIFIPMAMISFFIATFIVMFLSSIMF